MSNQLKTGLLLATLTGIFVVAGAALGGTEGMVIAFIMALVVNGGAWYFSDSIALRMNNAREIDETQAPELYRMVADLAENAELPMPKVYFVDTPMPNAFATGRNPENGAVAVTQGIVDLLDYDELAGVMAHELAHIKNRDTLISTIAASFAGAITMLARMLQFSSMRSGVGRSRNNSSGAFGAIAGLLTIILAPIAAAIIQMAISRSREFGADKGGAHIMGNPQPLADALLKMEAWSQRQQASALDPMVNPATSHLYIVNPLASRLQSLFRTHPHTDERVKELMKLQVD